MADISRNTTPAWQDPHLKDRGDYTEQDIQNIQEKGGILPDFTLDEAEETHLFARVAQALSKTLTRQGLAVRHEAKAAAEPMVFLVKSVFRVSSLIFFGFRHEECRPVVCFTGCPSCRT